MAAMLPEGRRDALEVLRLLQELTTSFLYADEPAATRTSPFKIVGNDE